MHFPTVVSLFLLFSNPLLAQEYNPYGHSLEIRDGTKKTTTTPSRSPSTASNSGSSPKAASGSSNAASGSAAKPAPNVNKPLPSTPNERQDPSDKKWYEKATDKVKSLTKSKDQKAFDKLHGDPFPKSTPNLKKMIDKEAELTTGTKATKANLETFQKPRYQAKLDRIKPQGDVAAAQLNIHNNKYKVLKDGAALFSQFAGGAKAAGVPALRRRAFLENEYRVARREVLRARALVARQELLSGVLPEEFWWV